MFNMRILIINKLKNVLNAICKNTKTCCAFFDIINKIVYQLKIYF